MDRGRRGAEGAAVTCRLCTAGFPISHGNHYGTQRLGMIPHTPCEKPRGVHLGAATDQNLRPWIAYAGGADQPLTKKNGVPRRFTTEQTALEAARAAERKARP